MACYTGVLIFVTLLVTLLHTQVWAKSVSSIGTWGPWTEWSPCSAECGPGVQDRSRGCLRHGACPAGSEIQTRSCQLKTCPDSQPSFRQKACSRYDKRVFSGKKYTWEPFIHSTDPCKISCRAKGLHFYANLASRAKDGELCHRQGQPKAVCYRGDCKPVGCDNILLSPARVDKCGVCLGDGSSCQTVAGIFTKAKLPRGINHVITIPEGSTSINITELSPSENHLILQSASGKVFVNADPDHTVSGTITAVGSTFQYSGKTSINPKESVFSKGPINTTVHVRVLMKGRNPGIAYSFSIPNDADTSSLQDITGRVLQTPKVQTAPLFVKENPSQERAALQGSADEEEEKAGNDENQSANSVGSTLNHVKSDVIDEKQEYGPREDKDDSADSKTDTVLIGTNIHSQKGLISPIGFQPTNSERSEGIAVESSGDENLKAVTPEISLENNLHGSGKRLSPRKEDLDETLDIEEDESDEALDNEWDGSEFIDDSDEEDVDDENSSLDSSDEDSEESNDVSSEESDDEEEPEDTLGTEKENDEEQGVNEAVEKEDDVNEIDKELTIMEQVSIAPQSRHYEPVKHRAIGNAALKIDDDDDDNYDDDNDDDMDDDDDDDNYDRYYDDKEKEEKIENERETSTMYDLGGAPTTFTPPAVLGRKHNQNSRRFKIPKFSKSFTFADRYGYSVKKRQRNRGRGRVGKHSDNINRSKIPSHERTTTEPPVKRIYHSEKRKQINKNEQAHLRRHKGGYNHGRFESRPKTVKDHHHFELEERRQNEKKRMQTNRQARILERNEMMRRRMEDYERRRRKHREMVLQRWRQQAQRLGPPATDLEKKLTESTNNQEKARTSHIDSEVKINPSSPLSPGSTKEKSVYIVATGNRDPSEGPRYAVSNVRPSSKDGTSNKKSGKDSPTQTRGDADDIISRTKPSRKDGRLETSSNANVIPRVQKNIDQVSRNIISRVAEKQKPTPVVRRKIISRISSTEKPIRLENSSHSKTLNENEPVESAISRGRQIIPSRFDKPTYVPNERGTYVSALSSNDVLEGGDPTSVYPQPEGLIPNRVDIPRPINLIPNREDSLDHNSVLPNQREISSNSPKILRTAGEAGRFSTNAWRISGLTECTHSCGGGVQQTVVVCVDTRTQAVVTDENCHQVQRPEVKAVTCNRRPCPAKWVPGPWTPCSVSCGDGEQTRTVSCQARVSPTLNLTMPESSCLSAGDPVTRQNCNPQPCSTWSVGNWSECSADCGDGTRSRRVQCVGANQEDLDDKECTSLKPDTEEECSAGTCGKGWFHTEWPEECPVTCGTGVLTRKVFCAADDGQILPENRCDSKHKPQTSKQCKADSPCGGTWFTGEWSKCNVTCGSGSRSRDVLCIKALPGGVYAVVKDENCAGVVKPASAEICLQPECQPEWYMTSWGQCSKSCGTGFKSREVKCLDSSQHNSDQCSPRQRPKTRLACNTHVCQRKAPVRNAVKGNEECRDKFTQCRVVKRARLCKYDFYKSKCCKSCS